MDNLNYFDLVGKVAPYHFLYGLSLSFSREVDNNRIRLKLKDYLLKDDESDGVIVENVILSIANISDDKDIGKNIPNAFFIVENFSIVISQSWINRALGFAADTMEEVKNLRVVMNPDKISIYGAYKKGITFTFAIDLKFEIIDNRLVIIMDRFWVGNRSVPLPKIFQKALLNYMQGYLMSHEQLIKGVRFNGQNIFVDHIALMPVNGLFHMKGLVIADGFMAVHGGIDFEEAVGILKLKEERIERGERIVDEQVTGIRTPGSISVEEVPIRDSEELKVKLQSLTPREKTETIEEIEEMEKRAEAGGKKITPEISHHSIEDGKESEKVEEKEAAIIKP
jgi:hypothetical protein